MSLIYNQLFVKPAYPSESFKGQTVIVTGSNTGLGFEAARHFARLDAEKVILAVRNLEAGEAAKKSILETTKRDSTAVEVWKLDLSSYDSVKQFASRAASTLPRIDVLMENAGVALLKYAEAEGQERTITINVISTFLLALLLLPKLKETAKKYNTTPHLTIVTSEVHRWTKFPERKLADDSKGINYFDVLADEKKYDGASRYQLSKLLEVFVVRELAPQMAQSGVVLNMLNPGLCHSELARDGSLFLTILKFFLARTTEVGSRTLVHAADAGTESHGKYMSDGLVKDHEVSSFVTDAEGQQIQARVWKELKDILERIQPGVTKEFK